MSSAYLNNMPILFYAKVLSTKEGLYDYVRPLDQYAENYLQLLKIN